MTLKAIVCSSCGDRMYSRCKEDVQECHCHRTVLQGETVLINGVELVLPQFIDIEVKGVDKDVLYWDWNLKTDNYGLISDFTPEEEQSSQYHSKYLIEL